MGIEQVLQARFRRWKIKEVSQAAAFEVSLARSVRNMIGSRVARKKALRFES